MSAILLNTYSHYILQKKKKKSQGNISNGFWMALQLHLIPSPRFTSEEMQQLFYHTQKFLSPNSFITSWAYCC